MIASGKRVVIVGAGHAGGSVAALLRQYGFQGSITLIGDEPLAPYHRPPLSKAWLKGAATATSLALKPPNFYVEHNIELQLDTRALKIERDRREVLLADGTALPYNFLILATGARPIALPVAGAELRAVMALRTAIDAEALKKAIAPGTRIAIVGGGYIGLEVAASCRALNAEVVVLERESRLLARVASKPLSDFFYELHQQHGVRFELNANVVGFSGKDGQVTAVQLADGRLLDCDAVVVGVGATPNDELATQAGLETTRGIVVDAQARTSDPHIFAIGDVTLRPMPIYQRMLRLESVPNVLEQAKQAACAITGRVAPPSEVPWQWSDQYDCKLQIAGYAFDVDRIVIRGDAASGKFAVLHLQGNRLQTVEAVNSPAEFMMGRQLIGSRTHVDTQALRDSSISLKDIAARVG